MVCTCTSEIKSILLVISIKAGLKSYLISLPLSIVQQEELFKYLSIVVFFSFRCCRVPEASASHWQTTQELCRKPTLFWSDGVSQMEMAFQTLKSHIQAFDITAEKGHHPKQGLVSPEVIHSTRIGKKVDESLSPMAINRA